MRRWCHEQYKSQWLIFCSMMSSNSFLFRCLFFLPTDLQSQTIWSNCNMHDGLLNKVVHQQYLIKRIKEIRSSSSSSLLVAELSMQLDDSVLLITSEVASPQVTSQVVDPSEATALAASQQSCILGKRPPRPCSGLTSLLNVVDENGIFLRTPSTFLKPNLGATRCSPH